MKQKIKNTIEGWRERLGLWMLSVGARLYFDPCNEMLYRKKCERFCDEINGDLLEAHTTEAGGHGYGDSMIKFDNRYWVGSSTALVLKRAFMMQPHLPRINWVQDAYLSNESNHARRRPVVEALGGQPGGSGPVGAAHMSTQDMALVVDKPKKKGKKANKKKDKDKKKKGKKS